MKKLPIGVQTFQKIRENDYVYVDKTQKEALAQIQAKGKKIVLTKIVLTRCWLFQRRKKRHRICLGSGIRKKFINLYQ